MELIDAIQIRKSRRSYLEKPLSSDDVNILSNKIKKINQDTNLNIQLVLNDGVPFNFANSKAMLSNVYNYIALIGNTSDANLEEKLGYFGELLALEAVRLNMGTCFIRGSYKKEICKINLASNEQLLCVIAIGYVTKFKLKENILYKAIHINSKTIFDLYEAVGVPNDWFIKGMEAVVKAPSAKNKMPYKFYFKDDEVSVVFSGDNKIDLGIAKLHFAIGAENGHWDFGNNVYKIENIVNTVEVL